jgi:hypothetical protein
VVLLVNILIGVLLITVGATLLNSISEIISAITELIKANINERIVRHNVAINKLSEGETQSRAIEFATTYEEEDEHEL